MRLVNESLYRETHVGASEFIVYYQELEYATHDCVQAYVVYYVMRIYMR